jgi:hypothetical protein
MVLAPSVVPKPVCFMNSIMPANYVVWIWTKRRPCRQTWLGGKGLSRVW